MKWYVYIVRCADGTLYTGITTSLKRRISEHNSSEKGARYTKSRRPVKLVYNETYRTRRSASRREFLIKRMVKKAKEGMVKWKG